MNEKQLQVFYEQIDFCHENIEWSHKIHEKAADFYIKTHKLLNWSQLILSFVIGCDVLHNAKTNSPIISALLVVCSILLALINTITKNWDFCKMANDHIATAKSLWELREDYYSFKTDIRAGLYDETTFLQKRQELQKRACIIFKQEPRTFDRAYNLARKDFSKDKITLGRFPNEKNNEHC